MDKKVERKRVAALLRAARDLMNDGGKHWVKGAEKCRVDMFHTPGDPGIIESLGVPLGKGQSWGYCMLGGIIEAHGFTLWEKREARITLARFIAPKKMERTEKRARKVYEFGASSDRVIQKEASSIIATANDAKKTKWADIKTWTTGAAHGLR